MSGSDHETVSFAEFLDYRARRLRPPVVVGEPGPPAVVTAPPESPEPDRMAVAVTVARDPRV